MASLAPFISREDLSDLLGEDLSSSDSALIAIDSACDVVRTEAEQTFNEVSSDEVILDGSGTDALLLPELPVTDVDSVTLGDEVLAVDDDYVLNGQGILLRVWPAVWTKGRQNVTVQYDHGYGDSVFPRDVRVVALRVAVRIFKQPATAAAAGVASESLGSYSISYTNSSSSSSSSEDLITEAEKRVLRKYKQSRSF